MLRVSRNCANKLLLLENLQRTTTRRLLSVDSSVTPDQPSAPRNVFPMRFQQIRARKLTDKIKVASKKIYLGSKQRREKLSIEAAVKRIFTPSMVTKLGDMAYRDQIRARWERVLGQLLPLGGASEANDVTLFNDGDEAWADMWRQISEARETILMETYMIDPDEMGLKTLSLLEQAAKRGVTVTFLYDCWGSSSMSDDHFKPLEATGASVLPFHPLVRFTSRGVLFRNHRKLLIIDHKVGFLGGMNTTKDYIGQKLGGTGKFRDTHCRIEGPAVDDLTRVFYDSLREAKLRSRPIFPPLFSWFTQRQQQPPGQSLSGREAAATAKARLDAAELQSHVAEEAPALQLQSDSSPLATSNEQTPSSGLLSGQIPNESQSSNLPLVSETNTLSDSAAERFDKFVQVLRSNVWRDKRLIQKAMRITIRSAKHKCYITNAYFHPPRTIKRAIKAAAQNGVDVRLLLAGEGMTDVPVIQYAGQHLAKKFLKWGCRVYFLQNKVLHAKTITIDGIYSSIGTYNFDRWSSNRNMEVNATILDPDTAKQIEAQFFNDLKDAKEVTLEDLEKRNPFTRFLHWASYYIARAAASV